MSEAWERPIYRDRHGRGERGVLTGIWRPQYRKRSAIFDALAVGQLKRLRTAWPDMINSIHAEDIIDVLRHLDLSNKAVVTIVPKNTLSDSNL